MVKKYYLTDHNTSKHGDEIHLPHLQCRSSDFPSKGCQVILVSFSHFLDETMFSKSFDHARDLTCRLIDEGISNISILKTTDIEFTSRNGLEQIEVVPLKEVESPPASIAVLNRLRDFFKIPDTRGGIIDARDEFQVPSIGRCHQLAQYRQAVNGLFDRSVFHGPRSILMFHPSVVHKKGNLVCHRLDAQDFALLVVHFNGDLFHMMLDACPFNPCVIIRTQFSFKLIRQPSTQEGGNVFRFNRMDRRAHQFLIDRGQVIPTLEDDIHGIFYLHKAPVIRRREVPNNGTVFPGESVELPMDLSRGKGVGHALGFVKVPDIIKSVVEHLETDSLFPESGCQFIVAVVIELQTERSPGRNTQIAEPEVIKDEVKIVMKTFPIGWLQEGLVRLLVVPGFVRGTRFHGREYVYQTGMCTPLGNDFTDSFLFAKRLSSYKLDLETAFLGNTFGVDSDLFSKRLGPFGVVKDPDFVRIEISRHSLGVANRWYRSGNDDTIKTGKYAENLIRVAFGEKFHGSLYLQRTTDEYSHKKRAA